jgi:hypothetical protein
MMDAVNGDPSLPATMATILDGDDDDDLGAEAALRWAKRGAKDVAEHPLHMARASVVDLLASARRPALEELRLLLASPQASEAYAVRAPECEQFVERLLPGVVASDGFDAVPVNGYRHDICHPEWADLEDIAFVEVARRHPKDPEAPEAFWPQEYAIHDRSQLAPLTTLAGGRVWSVYLATPGGANVAGFHASYPCQLLVRHDPAGERLVYDFFDHKPILAPTFAAAWAAFDANPDDAALRDAVATVPELDDIDVICKSTRGKRVGISGDIAMMFSRGMGGDDDDDDDGRPRDPLARAPRGSSHELRLTTYGAASLKVLVEHVRWKRRFSRRFRVDLATLVGARVVLLDAARPNGGLPLPENKHGLTVDDLGTHSREREEWGDGDLGRVAEGLIAMGADLEATAVLCLDFSRPASAFAATPVLPRRKDKRVRVACGDWTGGAASTATRHYVVGDRSEIEELANSLAAKDSRFAEKVAAGDVDPDPAAARPAAAPVAADASPSLIPGLPRGVPDAVQGIIGDFAADPPAPTEESVHEYLRSAGVADPEHTSACLRAGMLNGHVPMPDDPATFLDATLYEGGCCYCGKELVCTVRDALHQPDYAGLDYEDGGQEAPVQCEDCCGNYLTGICHGVLHFDSGKGHNHCKKCPAFGQCIGDYREAHCHRCGNHYFAGLQGFRCPCRGGGGGGGFGYDSMGDRSDSSSDFGPDGSGDDDDAVPLPPDAACWDAMLPGMSGVERSELLARAEKALSSKVVKLLTAFAGDGSTVVSDLLERLPTLERLQSIDDLEMLRGFVDHTESYVAQLMEGVNMGAFGKGLAEDGAIAADLNDDSLDGDEDDGLSTCEEDEEEDDA